MREPSRAAAALPLSALLLAAAIGCGGSAVVPERRGMVNDFAGLLPAPAAAALSETLEDYLRETCHEFVLLTVPSLRGEPIGSLSSRTMEAWGIGRGPLGSGLLLSISLEEGDARIDAGPGLEHMVRSGAAERVLQEEMFPLFARQRFEEGIRLGLERLMEEGRSTTYPEELRPAVCRPGGVAQP